MYDKLRNVSIKSINIKNYIKIAANWKYLEIVSGIRYK